MPSGVKNAADTFQSATEVIMATEKWQHALVYIDDIFIISPTPEKNTKPVKSVLCLASETRVTIKLKKNLFFLNAIGYLGYGTSPTCLHSETKTKRTIRDLTCSLNTARLCFILGLRNVYLRFVSNFARKAKPLNKLLKEGQTTKLNLEKNG